jgi:amino acid permease
MSTLLTIMLDVRADINGLMTSYAIPIIAAFLVIGAAIGVVMNFDKIVDKDGQGTRKEGIINLIWIVAYIIIGMAVLAGIIALVASKLKLSI